MSVTYAAVTPLDAEEVAWLIGHVGAVPDIWNPETRRVVFRSLWDKSSGLSYPSHKRGAPPHSVVKLPQFTIGQRLVGTCLVCGAAEGSCMNDTCIRTRVTNKLHLYHQHCNEECSDE